MSNSDMEPRRYFFGARGSSLIAAITVASSSAFLLLGYDQGVLSGIIDGPEFLKQFNNPSSGLQGTIVAIYDIGCLIGALFTAVFAEGLGRRKTGMLGLTIMASSIGATFGRDKAGSRLPRFYSVHLTFLLFRTYDATQIIGAALQCSSFSRAQLIVARIVTGFGNGLNAATFPMWNAEVAKPHRRGRVLSFQGSMIGGGIALSYWFDYGMSKHSGPVQWRFPVGFQIVFALVTLSMLFFLPESPRWLQAHGYTDEALSVLAALESKTSTKADEVVLARQADIQAALDAEAEGGPLKWKELWANNETQNRKRVLLACGINVFQQMSGCNALVYIPILLQKSVGMSRDTALLVGGLNGVVFFLASIYPLLFLDRFGRPKPFMVASSVQAISMFLAAILLSLNNPVASKAAVTFFFTYIAIFGTCYLGTPWMYGPELLPLRLRARAGALATAVNWICNFIIVQITPPAIANIQWKTYVMFGIFNAVFVPILWYYYPETANKTLEEIDDIFIRRDDRKVHAIASAAREKGDEEDRREYVPGEMKTEE